MRRTILLATLIVSRASGAQAAAEDPALRHSVEQLRTVVGNWNVTTDFLEDDGSVGRSERGTYSFHWIVEDRVVGGRSEIPAMNQASGILFYVNEARRVIEMVSVAGDGKLWIMTGPLGGEQRGTAEFRTAGGGTARLRFTRFNVQPDAFESRMEYSEDGGKTWKPANHQRFRRATDPRG
ncbi:MAG TPA: hypothetical protein VF981_16200 [Gemmatimonadaceae bacterium]